VWLGGASGRWSDGSGRLECGTRDDAPLVTGELGA